MTTTAVAGADGDGVVQPTTATETARILLERQPTPGVRIASSLFERPLPGLTDAAGRMVGKGGGTVTLSWRLIVVFATALLAIGGAASTALLRSQPVRVSAPTAPVPAPVRPAPVVVEALVSPPASPVEEVTAEPAPIVRPAPSPRTALETARRARVATPKRKTAAAASETGEAPATAWVDPFAD